MPQPPAEGFVKQLVLLGGIALLMAACSDASTSPKRPALAASSGRPSADLVCASGYVVAYDENGNPYCAPDPNVQNQARPRRLP